MHKPVRRYEKALLNDMMKLVRFPRKIRVQDPESKAYVLLQAAANRLEIKDFSLRVEQSEVVHCALRILYAIQDLCKERGDGLLHAHAIILDRTLHCRMWETNYDTVFRQCSGKGPIVWECVDLLIDYEPGYSSHRKHLPKPHSAWNPKY